MAILNRDVFLQIKEELAGRNEEFIEILPDVQARIVQLTSDAGFALVAKAQKDAEEELGEAQAISLNSYRWICACVVDENGNPVFQMGDLATLPFELVQRLAAAVNKVNGLMTPQGTEEAEKN